MLYCLRATELNLLPSTSSLVYMHGTRLTVGKPFVRKQYNVLVCLIVSVRSMEVPVELSYDYYCDLLGVPKKVLHLINNRTIAFCLFSIFCAWIDKTLT